MRYFLFFLLFACLSCGDTDPNADVKDMVLPVKIYRTDSLMYLAAKAFQQPKPDTMGIFNQYLKPNRQFWLEMCPLYDKLKADTSLSDLYIDSVLALSYYGPFLADKTTGQLMDSIHQHFSPTFDIASQLVPVFKRWKRDFGVDTIPAICTFVNGYSPPGMMPEVDQVFPTISGKYLALGLHYWMGQKFLFYSPDIPVYVKKRFNPQYMGVVVAQQIAEDLVLPIDLSQNPTLLDKAIRLGIRQCVVDALLPSTPDSTKMWYTSMQMAYCHKFEKNIFNFVKGELYSKDFLEQGKFTEDKPFTAELSRESAPRLAQYWGWEVVKSYMKTHSEVKIAALAERKDYEKIFKESGYKP